jgi:hypothetical protein
MKKSPRYLVFDTTNQCFSTFQDKLQILLEGGVKFTDFFLIESTLIPMRKLFKSSGFIDLALHF